MKGLQVYKSRAGLTCIRVHYSASKHKDPATPEGKIWLAKEAAGYVGGMNSSAWRREYEIDWNAAGGELVFPQFALNRSSIVIAPFEVPTSWPIYAGFDYGHRNPSAFEVFAIDHDGDFYTIWEYYESNAGYRAQASAIRACPYFERLQCPPIADPSIWALTQQGENEVKSIAQLFGEIEETRGPDGELVCGPVYFSPGQKGGDIAMAEKVNGYLWKDPEHPRWKIFASCPDLIRELERLRYADWSGSMALDRNKREKIVDRDNHAFDASKVFFNAFFQRTLAPAEDPMRELKKLDSASWHEWQRVAEIGGGRDAASASGFGEL